MNDVSGGKAATSESSDDELDDGDRRESFRQPELAILNLSQLNPNLSKLNPKLS